MQETISLHHPARVSNNVSSTKTRLLRPLSRSVSCYRHGPPVVPRAGTGGPPAQKGLSARGVGCTFCCLTSHLVSTNNPSHGGAQDEANTLRQYLSTQPIPSLTEPLSLPPALISLLLTHIDAASAETDIRSSSSTVNTALAQRAKLLQEENDELYELLKSSETGKLKEEVRGLRRAVNKLETALRGM